MAHLSRQILGKIYGILKSCRVIVTVERLRGVPRRVGRLLSPFWMSNGAVGYVPDSACRDKPFEMAAYSPPPVSCLKRLMARYLPSTGCVHIGRSRRELSQLQRSS